MYLVSHRNSSSKDGAVLNVVDQEAGVVKHLDDVANLANLKNNIQWGSNTKHLNLKRISVKNDDDEAEKSLEEETDGMLKIVSSQNHLDEKGILLE